MTIHSDGTPIGVRNDGGVLEHMLHQVEVECLPTDIPESFSFDVTELEIGDTVHVSDLAAPEGATIVTEGDRSVFAVAPPTVRKDEADEEAEEGAEMEEEATEPEVIERGKKEEDEDEA